MNSGTRWLRVCQPGHTHRQRESTSLQICINTDYHLTGLTRVPCSSLNWSWSLQNPNLSGLCCVPLSGSNWQGLSDQWEWRVHSNQTNTPLAERETEPLAGKTDDHCIHFLSLWPKHLKETNRRIEKLFWLISPLLSSPRWGHKPWCKCLVENAIHMVARKERERKRKRWGC